MTTPRHESRIGFTLVELLIAMTVIAILAGLIAPAVMRSLTTAKEFTVIAEMKQMELGLEQFKNDYGFYPPTFGIEITSAAQLRPYLNRISPQNAESSTSFTSSSQSRLQDWWDNVGVHLNERTGLVFWLSGMCKNKQFPLTGGLDVLGTHDGTFGPSGNAGTQKTLAAYAADRFSDGSVFPAGTIVERHDFFEFKNDRLDPEGGINGAAVAAYEQPMGDEESGELNPLDYRYRDYKSYGTSASPQAYYGSKDFMNPKKFQLVTFGRDGKAGSIDANNTGSDGSDNICNFTEGRLDKYFE